MSRFTSELAKRPRDKSPVKSTREPGLRTALGHAGYGRDTKGALFLLAVSTFYGQDAFHEAADGRADRFRDLVRAATVEDAGWTQRFIKWLRAEANIRSASVVAAVEYAQVPGAPNVKYVIDSVCLRADEPGEVIAYVKLMGYGFAGGVQRGVAMAAQRLYRERNALKYDTNSNPMRFGDVIQLAHVPPVDEVQDNLFKWCLNTRYGAPSDSELERLPVVSTRVGLERMPVEERREFIKRPGAARELERAGITWEALSGWLQSPMDAAAWEAIIPSMGLMAGIRNLRNFDQAGVSDAAAQSLIAKLVDPEEVRKSRLFPFRFYAAYKNAPSLRWAYPLETAINHSMANVPALPGRTLILVDRSPSMWMYKMSEKSTMDWADGAAIFGAALALRAESADLVEFGSDSAAVSFRRGDSVLKVVERFNRGNGTDIPSAVVKHLSTTHDRVVIVTDEQSKHGHEWLPSNARQWSGSGMKETKVDDLIPANVPTYIWNFGGYKAGVMPSGWGNRHTLGGLTDSAFALIPLLERGAAATWPF